MRRILHDLKILILTNLWIVPVIAGLVGALFYFAAPPPSTTSAATSTSGWITARLATSSPSRLGSPGINRDRGQRRRYNRR